MSAESHKLVNIPFILPVFGTMTDLRAFCHEVSAWRSILHNPLSNARYDQGVYRMLTYASGYPILYLGNLRLRLRLGVDTTTVYVSVSGGDEDVVDTRDRWEIVAWLSNVQERITEMSLAIFEDVVALSKRSS